MWTRILGKFNRYLFEFLFNKKKKNLFSKPQYTPAIGLPLNLFNCEFRNKTCRKTNEELLLNEDVIINSSTEIVESPEETDTTNWLYNEENLQKLIENIQSEWSQFSIK